LAEEMDCGLALMAERCGDEIANVYRNFINRLERQLRCHPHGLFQ